MGAGKDRQNENLPSIEVGRGKAETALLAEVLQHWLLIEHLPAGVVIHAPDSRVMLANPEAARIIGLPADRMEGKSSGEYPLRLLHEDGRPMQIEEYPVSRVLATGQPLKNLVVGIDHGPEGQVGWTLVNAYAESDGVQQPKRVVVTFVDVTGLKKAEQEIKVRVAELEAVNQLSTALRSAQTLEQILPILLDRTLAVMHMPRGAIWLYDPITDELRTAITRGYGEEEGLPPPPAEKPGEGIAGRVFASGQSDVTDDLENDERLPESVRRRIPSGTGSAAVAIRAANAVIGTFTVSFTQPTRITPGALRLLTTLCEIAGIAIQRTTLHEQTERRLQHLVALSEIDRIIASSFDLHVSLPPLLRQVALQLGVDAVDVLLYNPGSQRLEFFAGLGFRSRSIEETRLLLGEGRAGQAALERRTIHVADLREHPELWVRRRLLAEEDFVSYYGVPLIAKGQVKGLLEIFQRTPLRADREWMDFLNTLGRQAALAVDNVTLFEGLQRSNADLELAYDATIEGWSHALDLRDKETEGHTQRVTDMTVRLCRTFGLTEAELVQVRRGALLHDIGKMGVPDSILLKPGPLTAEEWTVMRKHPTFAYEMLHPIRYLRAALDIPRYHHEKWDGSGYPHGLQGEQIPLVARIFAVVDVWDALTSDRPYRPAWPKERVREHIRSLAGTHFDPEVARRCLESGVLG